MAPASTAVRSMASLVSLLLAVSMASAQSVQPSNATLPTSESGSEFVLSFTGGPIPTTQTYNIAPLTGEVGKGGNPTLLPTIRPSGNFIAVDYTNMNNVAKTDIAYISCDPNGSNIDPSTVVSTVGGSATKPAAILLYSLTSQECSLNGSFSYTSLFTTISLKDSASLMTYLANYPPGTDLLSANIAVNSTSSNSSSSPSSTANSGGPAPTTAVAMSILYSITGIITLLFLVIIATGAVRAHRHPERYGPRTAISGRPRQSRAKGLARAMLETLPIVKFGDPETTATKPNTQDLELGETPMASETTRDVMTTSGGNGEQGDEEDVKSHKPEATVLESGLGPAEESVHSHDHSHDDHSHEGHDHEDHDHSKKETAAATEEEGHLGCSICTDDFCTGEDVRVLPCNHKFHPACVDPWLLNVSGTCPLCRHDLRPKEEPSETAEGEEDTTAELPPPLAMPEESSMAAESESGSQHRSRAARLLDIHRLRHAPADERIAALRELREQTQNEGETAEGETDAEEPSRRLRLTGRLRDAFKIKTRTQDTPPSQ